jgi:hypothetical protein
VGAFLGFVSNISRGVRREVGEDAPREQSRVLSPSAAFSRA